MKKSLIALAVLGAFAGVASAQSSVTLYGQIDLSIGKSSAGAWGLNNAEGYGTQATSSMNPAPKDGYNSTTLFGFKGSEDLGGGARANFDMQTGGLDFSTGGTAVYFGREAWAGLSGGFGEIRLGRSSSIATKTTAAFDLNGISGSSAMVAAGISPVVWYGSSRRSAQIQYATPNLGGFTGRLGYTMKGNASTDPTTIPASTTAKARTSLAANFAQGPFALGFVAETASTANSTTLRTATALVGSYDAGVVKVIAGIDKSPKIGNTGDNFFAGGAVMTGKGYNLGLRAPIGQANIGGHVAKNQDTGARAIELFANYALSKRTRLYTDFVKTTGENAANPVAATATAGGASYVPANPKQIAFGIVHTF